MSPISIDSELPFDGIDPEIIIPLLKALPTSDCINGKKFWSTFKRWSSLTQDQKNKATVFWKQNISQSLKERLLTISRQQIVTNVADEIMTTKDDLARLLHLRVTTAGTYVAAPHKSQIQAQFFEFNHETKVS
jgi:hypothetical protein